MRLYSLILVVMCFEKALSVELHQPFAACDPLQIAPVMTALHAALSYAAAALETIVPTVQAVMPDKAPLVIGACTGCYALALRVSCGQITSVLGKQVSA